jgi:O-antigen ligase
MKTAQATRTLSRRFASLTDATRTWPWSTLVVLPLILVLGIVGGYSVSHQILLPLVLIVAAIPAAILIIRQPFDAVVVWLLVAPFFVVTADEWTRRVYWITHRTIIPAAAIVTLIKHLTLKRLRFGLIEVCMLAYFTISLFSILYYYSSNPVPELYHLYDLTVVGTALFWLIRTSAPRGEQLKRMMIAFIVISIVQGTVGLMMNISGLRSLLPSAWLRLQAERTTGTLGRDGEFSSTLAASLLLSAHYAFHARQRILQVLCWVAMAMGSLAILFVFSRATWLAAAVVAVLVIFLYRRMAPYLITALVVIAVILMATDLFSSSVAIAAKRFGYQRTIESRIVSDNAHLSMMEVKPLFGWGYGNYTRFHMDFVKPIEGVAVRDPEISSHNTFLNIGVELGLAGLAMYLMQYLLLFKATVTAYKKLPERTVYGRHLLLILWLGVVFWVVIANFQNLRIAAWGITWIQLLLGLIASITDATREPAPAGAGALARHPATV